MPPISVPQSDDVVMSDVLDQNEIQPVEEQPVQSNEPKPRLVINQIVMENFKSYAGRQVIGPFHKSFTSIVGPNGSGKSNVIDAFMFVLGFRAKKMRQAKLAELIHNSEGMLDVECCTVEVHFHSILDSPDGGFNVVPHSQLVVSRTAYRNSRNVYSVNGQTKSATEVTQLLKGHGIDLDHNRFLILQGEVESIAQMKPKAANEHEEGLLEYLEDIIGTSDYIKPIEEAGKSMEEAGELYAEKQVRVRAASKECESLAGEKERAESYLRQENALTELKSQRLQGSLFKSMQDMENANIRLAESKKKLGSETEKFTAEKEQIDQLAKGIDVKEKLVKDGEKVVLELSKELQKLEQEDVRLQETRKHLKNKIKGLTKNKTDAQKQKSEITRELENVELELKGITDQIIVLQQSLEHEEGELEKICKSLQSVTGKFQAQLDEKQKELAPYNERVRKEQQSLEIAISSRDLLHQKQEAASRELSSIQERIAEIEPELKLAQADKERLGEDAAQLKRQMKTVETELQSVSTQTAALAKELDVLSATVLEAKESLSQSATGGAILLALMKEKRSGRIPGVHGRLGDLGTIDAKYDTAVSTACSFLNHIVVDSTETGQKCIEHLRKHNLGRANFIILDKMRPSKSAYDLPQGAQRLFDLVRIKDAKLYSGAFYFALTDTLVAETIDDATRWAYHSGSKRYRVVTIDGKLIETSGTISGGGRPQRGGMKAAFAADGVTQDQVDQLEACLAERRQSMRQLTARQSELESERSSVLDKLSRNEALLIKAETLCANLPVELKDLESQLPNLRKSSSSNLSKAQQNKLKEAESNIKSCEENLASLRSEMAPIEASMASIQAQIMEAGGIKFKAQKSKVDGLKDQLEHQSGRSKKLAVQQASLQSRLESLTSGDAKQKGSTNIEAELAQTEAKIEELTQRAVQVGSQKQQASSELENVKEELTELTKQMSIFEKNLSKFKKVEYELKVKIEQDEDLVQESTRAITRHQAELNTLQLHHVDPNEPRPVLSVYEDADLNDFCKKLDVIEQQIRVLTERLQSITPNLRVLEEYRQKEERLRAIEEELAQLEASRQSCRENFEGLRQRRYDEFMAGFRTISTRLKEMYQLITLGGNAELELVDSLDPFSEGILFSVMPPKKSWKNICNLSGGEKTLSSLALVFALHTYKPTPIYVMDEIDAALDFRNVSIVAHYIKERTKDAQFIVISLRNDMFELADRLVGIYKPEQRTKSITIDPSNFALPQAATS